MTVLLFLVVSRWIHFAAMAMLFGVPFFWFWEGASCSVRVFPRALHWSIILLRVAAPVAALSGVAWLAGILANISGGFAGLADPQTLRLFFFDTQFGGLSALRLLLLALVVIIGMAPLQNRIWLFACSIVAGLLLVSQAWLGHAAEGGAGFYGTLMIFVYGVHVLAVSAWVGGLAPLVFVLAELWSFKPSDASERALPVLSRYSLLGMGAIILIIASGIANAAFRVGGAFGKLFLTAYGSVLGAKLLLVAAMLGLAYFNHFIAMPRLLNQAKGSGPAAKENPQIARLRRSVAIEWGLGLLVLGIAAILGITPPPQ